MKSITIPDNVTEIPNSCFLDCDNLTSVKIPTTVSSIEGGAFSCKNLQSITIPASVTVIGKWAFNPEYTKVIYGYTGTTAESYAKSRGIQFVPLDKYDYTPVTLYRLYFPGTHEHLYTKDANERRVLLTRGWKDEGVAWKAPKTSPVPVYRLFNPYSTDHHYTKDLNEYNTLCKNGWRGEGVCWYSDPSEGVPVYREFNRGLRVGAHNYTTDAYENNVLTTQRGWNYEGIAWYGMK